MSALLETRPSHKAITHAIAKLVGHPRSVLVVGGDLHAASAIAAEDGARVVTLAASGKANAGSGAGGEHATLESLIANKAEFDLVMIGDAAATAPDAVAFLRQFTALLSDGGHVLITLPPPNEAHSDAPAALTRDNAIKLVEDAELEVMRVEDAATSPLYVRFVQSMHSLVTKTPRPLVGEHGIISARRPPKPGKLDLTIGMLTLNEEQSVEQMIDDIRAVAPEAKLLIIDSSSDRTPELATAKGARVVRQLPPRGHGPAMERLMYEAAKQSDALIYLDCDFTYPTGTIKRLRELLESGMDVVNTSRTHRYPKEMPIPNFIANRFFAATAQVVHGVPTTDVHSGMRGYRCSVIRAFDFDGEGDALPLDTLILPAKAHYHVAELPIPYLKRVGESKLAKLRGTMWTFARIASAIGEGSRVRRGVRYRHVDD